MTSNTFRAKRIYFASDLEEESEKEKGFKNASEALDFVRAKSTNRNRKKIKDYPQLIASYEKAKKMGLCISGV